MERHATPEHRAHLPALADPRAHPRLPARGRVGAADAGRPGRLPAARAAVAALRRRRAAPPRRARCSRSAGSSARCSAWTGRRRAWARGCRRCATGCRRTCATRRPARTPAPALHLAVPARRRVGGGDRQPDDARGDAPRLGRRPRTRRPPRPDGRLREAERAARERRTWRRSRRSGTWSSTRDAARHRTRVECGCENGSPDRRAGGGAARSARSPASTTRTPSWSSATRLAAEPGAVGASDPRRRSGRHAQPVARGLVGARSQARFPPVRPARPRLGDASAARRTSYCSAPARASGCPPSCCSSASPAGCCSPPSCGRTIPSSARCGPAPSPCTCRSCANSSRTQVDQLALDVFVSRRCARVTRVPVEHRFFGLDRRTLPFAIAALAVWLLWTVVLPWIDGRVAVRRPDPGGRARPAHRRRAFAPGDRAGASSAGCARPDVTERARSRPAASR